MRDNKKLTSLLIAFSIGLVIACIAFGINFLFDSIIVDNFRLICGALSDAFFVAGICLCGVGLLGFAAREGTFDGLGFAFESIFVVRNWSPKRKFSERESFSEYQDRKQEERKEKKKKKNYSYYIAGAIYIVLAIIAVILYSVL